MQPESQEKNLGVAVRNFPSGNLYATKYLPGWFVGRSKNRCAGRNSLCGKSCQIYQDNRGVYFAAQQKYAESPPDCWPLAKDIRIAGRGLG